MIAKSIIVVNGLTGEETPVKVAEGATPANILKTLGLPSYQLARVKDRRPLRERCNVSRIVRDGERLLAFDRIVVGGKNE